MQTEWIKIDKMPRKGGPYIVAWFTQDGLIGLCAVVASRDADYWQCPSHDSLVSDNELRQYGYTHYAVITLPERKG
jgi:hypothetical protein